MTLKSFICPPILLPTPEAAAVHRLEESIPPFLLLMQVSKDTIIFWTDATGHEMGCGEEGKGGVAEGWQDELDFSSLWNVPGKKDFETQLSHSPVPLKSPYISAPGFCEPGQGLISFTAELPQTTILLVLHHKFLPFNTDLPTFCVR